jgi:hypothetical protein
MFCPKCGSNQGEERKFCTSCGTNLLVVSQALSGKFPQSQHPLPPVPRVIPRDRERELSKGLSLAIIGGGIMVGRLITYIFTGFHEGSPFGFLGFVGFVLLAIGVARVISYRARNGTLPAPPANTDLYPPNPLANSLANPLANSLGNTPANIQAASAPPQPVFSASSSDTYEAPRTSELEPVEEPKDPKPSVTEAETQTLPRHSAPPELQR